MKEDGSWNYVKLVLVVRSAICLCLTVRSRFSAYTDQGIKNLTAAEATERAVR